MKGWVPRLALRKRLKVIWKWPIRNVKVAFGINGTSNQKNCQITISEPCCAVIIFCHTTLASSAQIAQVNLPYFVSRLNM